MRILSACIFSKSLGKIENLCFKQTFVETMMTNLPYMYQCKGAMRQALTSTFAFYLRRLNFSLCLEWLSSSVAINSDLKHLRCSATKLNIKEQCISTRITILNSKPRQ